MAHAVQLVQHVGTALVVDVLPGTRQVQGAPATGRILRQRFVGLIVRGEVAYDLVVALTGRDADQRLTAARDQPFFKMSCWFCHRLFLPLLALLPRIYASESVPASGLVVLLSRRLVPERGYRRSPGRATGRLRMHHPSCITHIKGYRYAHTARAARRCTDAAGEPDELRAGGTLRRFPGEWPAVVLNGGYAGSVGREAP